MSDMTVIIFILPVVMFIMFVRTKYMFWYFMSKVFIYNTLLVVCILHELGGWLEIIIRKADFDYQVILYQAFCQIVSSLCLNITLIVI